MLSISDFFADCIGLWKTERTYHMTAEGEIERSYTEFSATPLTFEDKQKLLTPTDETSILVDLAQLQTDDRLFPGFAIAFDTVSEKGEKVSMSLQALFVPDTYVLSTSEASILPAIPIASQIAEGDDIIRGFYMRNEGYSEAGAIAGRFTYDPIRQTLEMTTYYKRSVAVDQMRFLTPDMRLRTIVTYKRSPDPAQPPTEITLVGFGLEQRYPLP